MIYIKSTTAMYKILYLEKSLTLAAFAFDFVVYSPLI